MNDAEYVKEWEEVRARAIATYGRGPWFGSPEEIADMVMLNYLEVVEARQ